jgi:hypothetical protein
MTKREHVSRNIGLTFDFLRHAVDHPEVIETIQDDAELNFIEKDVPYKETEKRKRKKIARYRVERSFEPVKF